MADEIARSEDEEFNARLSALEAGCWAVPPDPAPLTLSLRAGDGATLLFVDDAAGRAAAEAFAEEHRRDH